MRLAAVGISLVSLATVTVGWLQSPDHITAAEARGAAQSAYAAAGLRGAVVQPDPVAGRYVPGKATEPIAVWKTLARLDGGTVELWLSRVDGESVFLDDRAPDGSAQLLTDAQFRRLADHYENPAVGRQIRRNVVLTLASALVALLAFGVSRVARRPRAAAPPVRPVMPPAFRSPPRPGRPLRARQETR